MKTFLFAHNPNKWEWTDMNKAIVNVQTNGSYIESWGMFAHRQARIGDRAYLLRLGTGIKDKGIFGAGVIVSNPKLKTHWTDNTKKAYAVNIEFDTLSDQILLPMKDLREQIDYHWSIQASGLELEEPKAEILARMWSDCVLARASKTSDIQFEEGDPTTQISTRFERNKLARKVCIDQYGTTCQICGFNFKTVYGDLGAEFIHVHHIHELSGIRQRTIIDPIRDLRPVCPNCHAMLHKRTPAYTPEELKAILLCNR